MIVLLRRNHIPTNMEFFLIMKCFKYRKKAYLSFYIPKISQALAVEFSNFVVNPVCFFAENKIAFALTFIIILHLTVLPKYIFPY